MSDPMFAILVETLKKEYAAKGVAKTDEEVIKDAIVIYRKVVQGASNYIPVLLNHGHHAIMCSIGQGLPEVTLVERGVQFIQNSAPRRSKKLPHLCGGSSRQ